MEERVNMNLNLYCIFILPKDKILIKLGNVLTSGEIGLRHEKEWKNRFTTEREITQPEREVYKKGWKGSMRSVAR